MQFEKIAQDEPKIVTLDKNYQLIYFESTNIELNEFLINDSLKDQNELISRTYLSLSKNNISGYFSITADTIEVHAINENDGIAGYPYRKYPSIKIARLAVDKRFERKGIGRYLVLAAIGLALSVTKIIGCRYLTVDSKPESISFYEKLGFQVVEKYRQNEYPKMYLDMYPIIEKI